MEGLLCHLKEFALHPIDSRGLRDIARKASWQELPFFLFQSCYFSLLVSTLFLDYRALKFCLSEFLGSRLPHPILKTGGVNAYRAFSAEHRTVSTYSVLFEC